MFFFDLRILITPLISSNSSYKDLLILWYLRRLIYDYLWYYVVFVIGIELVEVFSISLFISIVLSEIQLSRGASWDPIGQFTTTSFW
jgi:hypothetical protein